MLVGVYPFYLVTWRYYRCAFSISYLMGIVVGLSSDISGLSHLNGSLVFGGSGFYDGDFWLPLFMLVLTSSAILFMKYLLPEERVGGSVNEK